MTASTSSKSLKPPKATPARRSNSATSMKQQTLGFSTSKHTRTSDQAKSKPSRSASLESTPPTTLITPKRLGIRSSVRDDDELQVVREKEPEIEVVHRESLNTSDKRWNKAYGAAREKMGNIPPIHAEGQTKVHHILRVFDMNYEYGPCVGVTRLQRWERAQALGLEPPREIFDILNTKEGTEKDELAQCVLYEKAVEA